MAVLPADAVYFAARRSGGVVTIDIEDDALLELITGGARRQPIPMTPMSARFDGDEFFVPVDLFDEFNAMREEGRIHVY